MLSLYPKCSNRSCSSHGGSNVVLTLGLGIWWCPRIVGDQLMLLLMGGDQWWCVEIPVFMNCRPLDMEVTPTVSVTLGLHPLFWVCLLGTYICTITSLVFPIHDFVNWCFVYTFLCFFMSSWWANNSEHTPCPPKHFEYRLRFIPCTSNLMYVFGIHTSYIHETGGKKRCGWSEIWFS